MRLRLGIGLVLLALLAACGGDDDDDDVTVDDTETTVAGDSDDGDDDDDAAAEGDADCASITTAQDQLVFVQILAQLRSQDQVDAIRGGTPALDPDEFIAAMEELRELGGVDEAIDVYVAAGEAAKVILANDGPVPQEDFDALEEITGPIEEVGTFLAHQATIGIAMEEAGCS